MASFSDIISKLRTIIVLVFLCKILTECIEVKCNTIEHEKNGRKINWLHVNTTVTHRSSGFTINSSS